MPGILDGRGRLVTKSANRDEDLQPIDFQVVRHLEDEFIYDTIYAYCSTNEL